jgi:hypothetical protein
MDGNKPSPARQSVQTASGRISYTDQGRGAVALFVHGVLLNGHLWRHQLAELADIRRCLAVDLLAHGDTEIAPDQDVSVTANAKMLKEFLDALNIAEVDLVATTAAAVLRRFSPRCIRSACAPSLSPIATPMTTGRPKPSSHFLRWRPPAVYVERWMRCCRTSIFTDRRRLWDQRMNIRSSSATTVSNNIYVLLSGASSALGTCNGSSQLSTISTRLPLKTG